MLNGLADLVSNAWWTYPLIFALSYADALVPIVPSETAVITAGVLAGSGHLSLPLVILTAATGAALGDNTAYFLGRRFEQPIRRLFFTSDEAKKRITWAERQITQRGGELIVIGRFIPGGRTVVTFASGWLEMPWRRFVLWDALACSLWASYAALLGYIGGHAFESAPWKGLLLAFAVAFGVTGAVEGVRWLRRKRH